MPQFPKPIQNLIEEFNKLPGIGPKTSERFVYYLLRQPRTTVDSLAQAIKALRDKVVVCNTCHAFAEYNPCAICRSSSRDKTMLCVVAESPQVQILEKTREYNGLYFVLGGVLNPVEGITPDRLNIRLLVERLKKNQPKIKEVILALNPDVEGESTGLYLKKILQPHVAKVSRLARGLPVGADLEYADEVTLADALKGRH